VNAYDNPYASADLHAFDVAFGLPDPSLTVYNRGAAAGSAVGTGWDHEIDLDLQWAHAVAPGASIALVEAADDQIMSLMAAVDFAVNTLSADVVSMSWGTQGEYAGQSGFNSHYAWPQSSAGRPSGGCRS
jgi:subtilase family serine protease